MDASGALEHARTYAHELTAQAKARLANVDLDLAARETLLSMADFFVERKG
jgi:geranylgeranyl diphosphate synthase type I